MIARYESAAMTDIWSDQARLERWRLIEVAVVQAQAELGITPPEVHAAVAATPTPSVEQVRVLEAVVRHDVVAFLLAFTEPLSADEAGHVHRHLTSSDIVDSAQALALVQSSRRIQQVGRELVAALCRQALVHRGTICVARTHGQAAAPDVFGHRLADIAFAADRALNRFEISTADVSVLKLSGPVGTGIGLDPILRSRVAAILGLHVPPVTTQVVFRDATAAWVSDLAVLAAVCEAFATDVRLAAHDGVGELSESRSPDHVGSSSMPHKNNPVSAEQLCGLARMLRSYVGPALEDIALWQHRDISHSSVERIMLPDVSALAEHLLTTTEILCNGLVVNDDVMLANVARAGRSLVTNRRLSHLLQAGTPRPAAMRAVAEWATGAAPESPPADASGPQLDPDVIDAVQELRRSETLLEVFDSVEDLLERNLTKQQGLA